MNLYVSEAITKNNPNFVKLFDQLQNKLSNDSLSAEASKLWLSKSEWLEGEVVLSTVHEVLKDIRMKILNKELDEDEQKCWEAVKRCLSISKCCVCFAEDQPSPVLQLTLEKLNNLQNSQQAELAKGKLLLANEVEKKLLSNCVKLTKAQGAPEVEDNTKLLHAKASQIGEILKRDKFELVSNQERLKDMLVKEMTIRDAYHQELQECATVLSNLVTKYCLRLHPHKDQTVLKNSIVSCQTLASKLKSIRIELKCETYTPRHLEALKKLRTELTEKIQRRESEAADAEEQLKIYRRLGREFEEIAVEYGNTKSDCEKQLWTLNELKKRLNSDSAES